MSGDMPSDLECVRAMACALAAEVRNVTDRPVALIPEGYRLAELEPYLRRPTRYTGTFSTRELEAMRTYVAAYLTPETRLFIDPDRLEARAIFDMGAPGAPDWRTHSALLTLGADPAFAALATLAAQPVQPAQMLDFIADWHALLAFAAPGDDQTLSVNLAAQRLQKFEAAILQAQGEGDPAHGKTLGERRQLAASAPIGMTLSTSLYLGLAPLSLPARLTYLIDPEPMVRVRLAGVEGLRQKKIAEFREALTQIPGLTAGQIFIGTFSG